MSRPPSVAGPSQPPPPSVAGPSQPPPPVVGPPQPPSPSECVLKQKRNLKGRLAHPFENGKSLRKGLSHSNAPALALTSNYDKLSRQRPRHLHSGMNRPAAPMNVTRSSSVPLLGTVGPRTRPSTTVPRSDFTFASSAHHVVPGGSQNIPPVESNQPTREEIVYAVKVTYARFHNLSTLMSDDDAWAFWTKLDDGKRGELLQQYQNYRADVSQNNAPPPLHPDRGAQVPDPPLNQSLDSQLPPSGGLTPLQSAFDDGLHPDSLTSANGAALPMGLSDEPTQQEIVHAIKVVQAHVDPRTFMSDQDAWTLWLEWKVMLRDELWRRFQEICAETVSEAEDVEMDAETVERQQHHSNQEFQQLQARHPPHDASTVAMVLQTRSPFPSGHVDNERHSPEPHRRDVRRNEASLPQREYGQGPPPSLPRPPTAMQTDSPAPRHFPHPPLASTPLRPQHNHSGPSLQQIAEPHPVKLWQQQSQDWSRSPSTAMPAHRPSKRYASHENWVPLPPSSHQQSENREVEFQWCTTSRQPDNQLQLPPPPQQGQPSLQLGVKSGGRPLPPPPSHAFVAHGQPPPQAGATTGYHPQPPLPDHRIVNHGQLPLQPQMGYQPPPPDHQFVAHGQMGVATGYHQWADQGSTALQISVGRQYPQDGPYGMQSQAQQIPPQSQPQMQDILRSRPGHPLLPPSPTHVMRHPVPSLLGQPPAHLVDPATSSQGTYRDDGDCMTEEMMTQGTVEGWKDSQTSFTGIPDPLTRRDKGKHRADYDRPVSTGTDRMEIPLHHRPHRDDVPAFVNSDGTMLVISEIQGLTNAVRDSTQAQKEFSQEFLLFREIFLKEIGEGEPSGTSSGVQLGASQKRPPQTARKRKLENKLRQAQKRQRKVNEKVRRLRGQSKYDDDEADDESDPAAPRDQLEARVRHSVTSFLQIYDWSIVAHQYPTLTAQEQEDYKQRKDYIVPTVSKNFRPDFKLAWKRHPFNKENRHVFIELFLARVEGGAYFKHPTPQEMLTYDCIGFVLDNHMKYCRQLWRRSLQPPSPEKLAQLAKGEAQRSRRKTLRDSREVLLIRRGYNQHCDLFRLLQPCNMSGDETDGEKTTDSSYRIIVSRWQSQELRNFFWAIDGYYREDWAHPTHRCAMGGNRPRTRVLWAGYREDGIAPIGLWRNCYDKDWLAEQPSYVVHELEIVDEDYDFSLPTDETPTTTT